MSKFHISMQILRGNALFSEKKYTAEKIYTTAGRDGCDKFQVCTDLFDEHIHVHI